MACLRQRMARRVVDRKLLLAVLWWIAATPLAAQTREYRPNPADEDWTFLKTAPNTDLWDPIKYVPLGPEDWSLTMSGEARFRAEGFRIRETPGRPSATDSYLLQRYLFGTEVRLGTRARLFGELQSGLINGRLRSPRPTDRNSLDIHQAFFEWRQPFRQADRFLITVGRQEIEIGSSRLISASPGLNVKRSFDGVVLSYRAPTWTVGAVGAKLVALEGGVFDDSPDWGQAFWGVAAGRRGPMLERSELGVYYLGIENDRSTYVQGIGSETRHTIGVKWNAADARLDLNYDAVFQWGRFAGAPVRAWAFATETGYRFPSAPWRPRVSIRSDIASGDDDADAPALHSFNPLFPGNSYSGAVGLFGPTNLTDLTPAVAFVPHGAFRLSVEAPIYWRTSTADGVYSTDLRVLLPPSVGEGHYVGTNPGVVVVWQLTRHLQMQGAITRFIPGQFLQGTFVSNGFGFYSVTSRYRF